MSQESPAPSLLLAESDRVKAIAAYLDDSNNEHAKEARQKALKLAEHLIEAAGLAGELRGELHNYSSQL